MSNTKTISQRFRLQTTVSLGKNSGANPLSQRSRANPLSQISRVQKTTSSFNSSHGTTPPSRPIQKTTSSFNSSHGTTPLSRSLSKIIQRRVSSSITSISPLHSQIANSITKKGYSFSLTKLRMDIAHNDNFLHFSRVPSEDDAKLVLELFSSQNKSALLRYFSTPIAILRSKREDLYSPIERAYLISEIEKSHMPLKKTRLSKYRIKIAGKLVSILAFAHSLGILIGDTTADNIAVKNNTQPIFRSAGHMRAMSTKGEGISEFLLLLCNLMRVGAIFTQELIHLIRHYLATNKDAYIHAEYYLHGQKGKKEAKIDEALKAHLLAYYSKYFA